MKELCPIEPYNECSDIENPGGGGGARLSPASSSSKHSDGGNRNVGVMFGGSGGGRAPSKAHPAASSRLMKMSENDSVERQDRPLCPRSPEM